MNNRDGIDDDRRPIVTCAGDLEVFTLLEESILEALPKEPCEWRRSLGRPSRMVHITATFTPFKGYTKEPTPSCDLIRQPVLHTYWTECQDVETYKTGGVKDGIESWLKDLSQQDIGDFLIVAVERYDSRIGRSAANKLLPTRTVTVLDRIRSDFAQKNGDRCVSVINPGRLVLNERTSTESWRSLIGRLRHLLVVAYGKAVNALEDYVRQQRERRIDVNWDLWQYFHLQEELALVLEMLGLHDEALKQYDEFDAFLSQCIVNGVETSHWLRIFLQKPVQRWCGLRLDVEPIQTTSTSLLEFRTYIFAKQCQMILNIGTISQIAIRCLPFLHTTSRELILLDVVPPSGALNTWQFLCSLGALQICGRFTQDAPTQQCTAPLWDYASEKLRLLGHLCGLVPNGEPSSEQLHLIVGLSAGMGDHIGTKTDPTPTDRLKEALCSQNVFNKLYLELTELAMGTYKHIGRLRNARLIGRRLASFYLQLGQVQKAVSFLTDLLRIFEEDSSNWPQLQVDIHMDLIECYQLQNDQGKLVKSCAIIAATPQIDTLQRWTHFDQMQRILKTEQFTIDSFFERIFRIQRIQIENATNTIWRNWELNIEVALESYFPRECTCTSLWLSTSVTETTNQPTTCVNDAYTTHLDYKEDKQLASASVVVVPSNNNSAKDDEKTKRIHDNEYFRLTTTSVPFIIKPGLNRIHIQRAMQDLGQFELNYLGLIIVNNLQLTSDTLKGHQCFQVAEVPPTISLCKPNGLKPLYSGVEQFLDLIVTIGSYEIDPESTIRLNTSHGLKIQFVTNCTSDLVSSLEMICGPQSVFTGRKFVLRTFAEILSCDHQVVITWSPLHQPIVVKLDFQPPILVQWRLQTVNLRKFINLQVVQHENCDFITIIPKAQLQISNASTNVKLIDKNPLLIPDEGTEYTFLWEIKIGTVEELLKGHFQLQYRTTNGVLREFHYFFQITNFRTLYVLDANIEPARDGGEFCRVGVLCHLQVSVENCHSDQDSVMYEVLAEQNIWAVLGRTAGVISFDPELSNMHQKVTVDVMPLTSGYLPLPLVQISRYIPAISKSADGMKGENNARLEIFSAGQVYNGTKGKQIHVIAAIGVN